MDKRFRVGIIGCGDIGRGHARAYRRVEPIDLVAAADINPAALDTYCAEFEIPAKYTDYNQMLEREKLDIVSVCTWPQTHVAIVRDAVRHPLRAIYCEKPLCMSLGEADEIVALTREAGIPTIVGHQRRYVDRWIKAKEIAHSGAIGEIVRLEAACEKWDIFQWGTHWIDMLRYYNNDQPVDWAFAQVDRRWDRIRFGHRLETECIALFGFRNGVRGYVETGDHVAGFYNRIIGTEGIVEVNQPNVPLRARVKGERDWLVPPLDETRHGIQTAIERLLDTIETGAPHRMSLDSARATQEVIMAIYQSALTGRLVELPLAVKESPFAALLARAGIPLVVS
ncbi:MAG: Gfo/Idh/MocA family oxidoreductase [Chloroflexi bacterium]|nr:Gfo/Idh/MocA family oxidoreductase [Chloroflexota bacterium]